jgi:hypothetical protein
MALTQATGLRFNQTFSIPRSSGHKRGRSAIPNTVWQVRAEPDVQFGKWQWQGLVACCRKLVGHFCSIAPWMRMFENAKTRHPPDHEGRLSYTQGVGRPATYCPETGELGAAIRSTSRHLL